MIKTTSRGGRHCGLGGCVEQISIQTIETDVAGAASVDMAVCPHCDRPARRTPWFRPKEPF